MTMLARLKYLTAEGFEVASLSGYDDIKSEYNAKILYLVRNENGHHRVCSEIFAVDADEMEQCCTLFFSYKPHQP